MKQALDNIFLIGPMGAGKTTIGRQLARELKKEFIDSDQEIEDRTGANISWIFDVEGEAGFRQREKKIIEELTSRKGIVLATGGGAVLSPENRKYLHSRGTVVYLMATIGQQVERTKNDSRRPLIQNVTDIKGKLKELMEIRDPLYREIADYVVMTNRRSPKSVSSDIVKQLFGDEVHEL
jgi:shikimate kinase